MNVHFVTFFGKSISASVVGIHYMVTKAELCASTVRNKQQITSILQICFFLISVGASFKPIHDEATNSTSSVTQTTTATEASTVIASHPDPDQPTGNTTANSATVSGSGLTENSSSNQQPQNSGSSVPDSSGANHTENTPPVKPTATSAASKAAAFFTSGKMSSSSTEKIKSKSSLVEGSDCEYPFFAH